MGLRAVLVTLLTSSLVTAQQIGGGSTENFKRPENPPVHHRPKPEVAGGRLTGIAGAKQSARQTPDATSAAGAPPGAVKPGHRDPRQSSSATAKSGPRPSATPAPSILGAIGGVRSGGGGKPIPKGTPEHGNVANSLPPPPDPSKINEAVEDAIESGNAARDEKPADYSEAERAYKLAAQLAPDDLRAFVGLGNIYLEQQRDEEAVAAYRKAIELKSKNPDVFEALGDLYFRMARYPEAIDASAQSVRVNATRPGPFWTLAWVSLTLGKGEDAGRFAQAFIYRWRPFYAGDPFYYITFAGYLGYREAGRNEEANTLLAGPGASSECQDQNWVCRLFKYLRHEVTAQQLLAEANTNDKMTEARTYIGIDLALSGRRAEALPHLRWVIENGNKAFVEYHLAKAWIAKLEKPQ